LWLNLQSFFDLDLERRTGGQLKLNLRCIPLLRRLAKLKFRPVS
jgi:plasmid maintenance system antidote protein VapI